MSFNKIITKALTMPKKTIAIACPENDEVIQTVIRATEANLCNFVLFGDKNKINIICKENNFILGNEVKIFDVNDQIKACNEAVKYVSYHQADILMKGFIDTSIILKEVLNRDYGLRTTFILNHVMVCKLPKFSRFLLLSDGALNIEPSIDDLIAIVINTISFAKKLGISNPKAALLSAVEKINPKMPSTIKCQKACEYFTVRNNNDVYGPIALDSALDPHSATLKDINNPVVGAADILIAPFIEVINVLYKGWVFGSDRVESGGIILGAKAPIVLVSRADSPMTKINSIALAIINSSEDNS